MKTKLFLIILLLLLGINLSLAQPSVKWKNKIEGYADQPWVDSQHPGKCIATDADGNIVVVGGHANQLDLDGSSNTYPISANGQAGGYVASYTNTGQVRWGFALNSDGWDEPMGVSIDPYYNVYIYGFFEDTIDLDPGPGVHEIWPMDGDRDLYIVKFDSSGNYIHSIQLETEYINPASAYIYNLEFDSNMNIYIAGFYRGYFDADPGPNVFYLENYPGTFQFNKGFIIKYDSTFQLLDGWSIASPIYSENFVILDFNLTSDGGFYITGHFKGEFDIDLLTSISMENTNGKTLGFLGKYDSTGSLQWFQKIETQYHSVCTFIVVDSLDNATIMGRFGGKATFYQLSGDSIVFDWTGVFGDYDYFILKYDTSGNPIWGKHLDLVTGTAQTYLIFNSAEYMKGTDELWISCSFHSSINMDVGVSNYIMSTSNSGWPGSQMSVLHYNNSSGTLLGAYPFEFNSGSTFLSNFLTVHGNELSMWGSMPINPDIDLDLGPDTNFLTTNIGGMYIVRYCPSSSQTVTACDSYFWNGNIYTASGTYTHTSPNTAGCDSVMTLTLTINNVDTTVTASSDSLTANATGATYQWLNCDSGYSVITGATNQSFVPTVTGNYAVSVTQNSCTDTSACYSVIVTGIAESNKTYLLLVYPNPNNGVFTIEQSRQNNIPYTITDITGKMIQKGLLTKNRTTIDLSANESGMYLLKIDGQTIRLLRQ